MKLGTNRNLLIIFGVFMLFGGWMLHVYRSTNKHIVAQGCWRQAIYLQRITMDPGFEQKFQLSNAPPSWNQILAVESLKKDILSYPRLRAFVDNGYRDYYGNPLVLTNRNKESLRWQILISRRSYERIRVDMHSHDLLQKLTPVETP